MQINQAIWMVNQKAENMNQPMNVFSYQILLCSLTKFSAKMKSLFKIKQNKRALPLMYSLLFSFFLVWKVAMMLSHLQVQRPPRYFLALLTQHFQGTEHLHRSLILCIYVAHTYQRQLSTDSVCKPLSMFFKSLVTTSLVKQLGRKTIEKEEELRGKNTNVFSNPAKVTVGKGKF